MNIKFGIAVRLASFIIIASLAIAFVASEIFYKQTYNAEVSDAKTAIGELVKTISPTASIAAFVSDEELLKEAINGLARSKNVKAIAYTDEKIKYRVNEAGFDEILALTFDVQHPFIPTEKLGEISITPDYRQIESDAELISSVNSFVLYLLAILVTIASIVICYFLVTRPLVRTSKALYEMEIGAKGRVVMPPSHSMTEIGTLVRGANRLLDNVESQFTQERKLRKEIEGLEQRFRMIFESAKSAIVLIDESGKLVLYNESFVTLLESLGLYINQENTEYSDLLIELFEEPKQLLKFVRESLRRDEIAIGEYKLKGLFTSKSYWVQLFVNAVTSDQNEKYYQVTLSDISKRKQDLEQLEKQADFDALTQILNRNGGEKKIEFEIVKDHSFAIVLIDLNGFKQVNDTYGHDAGDAVLIEVAKRLSENVRHDDTVIRWGGDEFVLLLQIDKARKEMVIKAMDKVRESITRSIDVGSNYTGVSIGMSAGVAFFPDSAVTLDNLVKEADQAMYKAKELKLTAPDKYLFFSDK